MVRRKVHGLKVHGLKAYGLAQDRFQWSFGCDMLDLSLPRAEMKF